MTVALLLAASLPLLFVDGGPDAAVKEAGVTCVAVPAAKLALWQGQCAQSSEGMVKAPTPGVRYRMNEARASSAPWVDSNGARFLRDGKSKYLITAGEGKAALAAAEAWAWGVDAAVAASPKDYKAFGAMQQFLKSLPAAEMPVAANIGFLDDGSDAASENMNLMLRRNLMFRVVKSPDPKLAVNVKPEEGDPNEFAYQVRKKVGDEKRQLRLYGSEVVIARLTGEGNRRRVTILNYGNRPAEGVRVRVLGKFPKVQVHSPGGDAKASDIVVDGEATEFSLPKLTVIAVVDLNR